MNPSLVSIVGGTNSLAELWRSTNGTTWSPVFTDGLGDANNTQVSSLGEYQGNFYVGLRNTVTGGRIWGSSDGTTFPLSLTVDGFHNANNKRPYGLYVHGGALYILWGNWTTGGEVWRRTPDGWSLRIVQGGWGDADNRDVGQFDKAVVTFNNALYVGTGNSTTGGQIWQMLNLLYVPLVVR